MKINLKNNFLQSVMHNWKNKTIFELLVRGLFVWVTVVLTVEMILIIQHIIEYGLN